MSIVFEKKFQKNLCPTYSAVFQRYKSGINSVKAYAKQKKMNGKYQVGSGRVVTFTHDTPFIENNATTDSAASQVKHPQFSEKPKRAEKAATVGGRTAAQSLHGVSANDNIAVGHTVSYPPLFVKPLGMIRRCAAAMPFAYKASPRLQAGEGGCLLYRFTRQKQQKQHLLPAAAITALTLRK